MTTIIDTLILLLMPPTGFALVIFLLFTEYLIAESIIKDTDLQLDKLGAIFKKKFAIAKGTPKTNGIDINYIAMNEWLS